MNLDIQSISPIKSTFTKDGPNGIYSRKLILLQKLIQRKWLKKIIITHNDRYIATFRVY